MSNFDQTSFTLDDSLGRYIHLLNQYKDRLLNERLAMHDITAAQFKVLLLLSRHGKMTPGNLRQMLKIDSAAITRMLDRLEEKGLVYRSHSTADRRSIDIALTGQGDEFARHIPGIVADTLNRLTEALDGEEAGELTRLIRKVLISGGMLH